jgi:hypothetical protein
MINSRFRNNKHQRYNEYKYRHYNEHKHEHYSDKYAKRIPKLTLIDDLSIESNFHVASTSSTSSSTSSTSESPIQNLQLQNFLSNRHNVDHHHSFNKYINCEWVNIRHWYIYFDGEFYFYVSDLRYDKYDHLNYCKCVYRLYYIFCL